MSLPTGDDILDFITYRNAVEEGEYQPDVHPDPDLLDDDCGAFVEIGGTVSLGGETVTDNKDLVEERWLRIPIHGVEQWINKDGPASMNRTTKVVAFNEPTLDGEFQINTYLEEQLDIPHDEITLDKYVNKTLGASQSIIDFQLSSGTFVEGFLRGRVYFYDSELDEYKLTQHGYVGSYGPTDNTLLRKFWIYDVADLARNIPVGQVFEDPTINRLINFVLNGTDDTGKNVGINNTTPFTVTKVVFPQRDELASRTLQEFDLKAISPTGAKSISEASLGDVLDVLSSPVELFEGTIEFLTKDTKEFSRNRNNLVDVLNFIGSVIDGIWYFEPAVDGVELHIRANWSKTDYGRTFQDQTQVDEKDKFTVSVKENTALTDIKPINTISVNGNSVRALPNGDQEASGPTVLTGESFTESYPYVKLRYDPFYKAAGNQELGPTDVRSNATDLETVERQAYEEFVAHVEETTEGRIELFGDPMPLPYDFIDAIPACRGQQITDANPIPYSINDVHHQRYAGEPFTTELGVHAKVEGNPTDGDGSNFTVTKEYRQAQ